MSRQIKGNPFLVFLVGAALSYAAWYVLYDTYLDTNTGIDRLIIENLIDLSGGTMELMGYTLIPEPSADVEIRTVGIDGTYGLWIGNPCNGLVLFALFSIFMIWYPGPWKHKAWFLPFGLITIHLVNVIRIIALCIIVTYDYAYLDFNHNYTFTIVVYGYMFLLWLWWASKLAPLTLKAKSK